VYVIVRLTLQCFEKLLLKVLYRIKFIIIIILRKQRKWTCRKQHVHKKDTCICGRGL